ncbi:MAG: HDIG domain-containing protein [Bdellovibrionota bacterium]|nr:MAG: HDIG domain-containing protein [Bdellovibrionota bacterium]
MASTGSVVSSLLRTPQGLILAALSAVSAEGAFHLFVPTTDPLLALARVAIVFIAVLVIFRLAQVTLPRFGASYKDTLCLAAVLVGGVVSIFLGEIFAVSLSTYIKGVRYIAEVDTTSFAYLFPFAAGALLLQSVLGLHYSLVYSLIISMIIGVYYPHEFLLAPYTLITTFVACLGFSQFRSRSAYLKGGLYVSLFAFAIAFCSVLLDGDDTTSDIAVKLVGSLLNGFLSCFIASGLTPVFEYLGGYATDMRLIEMATLDHPLLKELSVQAPGTWNHSMVMGMMAESAAESIGANPVLSRVGAYFHDIGKTKKPLYFVENQLAEENRHDKLSPSMSALIIRSHVKDGLELAKKHGLPLTIQDMIGQHHGTMMIEFFYEKALREAREQDPDAEVDPSPYTYPGPKPQTREAGILLLADGIEAAARTMSEPDVDRIQGMVQKMINKVFSSGQLEESQLTLRDLHLIAKSFTRVLTGIHHKRIAYAEPVEKLSEKSKPQEGEAPSAEVASFTAARRARMASEESKDKEASKEDLKRLGIS